MDYRNVLFVAVALLLLLLCLYMRNRERGRKFRYDAANISFDGFLLALTALLAFVPQIGYITIVPGISFTLVHIPVLLAAMVGGRRKGLLLGTAFGVTSMFVAMTQPVGLNALFVLPYIAIPPRMLFGYFSGLLFEGIGKLGKGKGWLYPLSCFLLTCLHTVLVFGFLFLFAYEDVISMFATGSLVGTGLFLAFGVLILIGMLGEGTLGAVVAPLLSGLLKKAVPGYYRRLKGE